MRQPYNLPQREPSDMGLSTRHSIPYVQEGIAISGLHTAYTYIPCDIANPVNVQITPVLEGRSTGDITNGIAFFTTVVGWYVSALLNESLSALTAVDDWIAGTIYKVGSVVLDPADTAAYVCIVDHTADSGGASDAVDFAEDVALGYWQLLSNATVNTQQKFIKIIHTSPGAGNWAQFMYRITGYRDQ